MIFGNKDEIITLKTIQDLCNVPSKHEEEKEQLKFKKIFTSPKIIKIPETIEIEPAIIEETKPEIKPPPEVKKTVIRAKAVRIEKPKNEETPKIKENQHQRRISFNNGGDDILWL